MNIKNINVNSFIKNNSFAIISALVVSLIPIMLFPVSEFILDTLIACNITLSLIILLTSIRAKNPLDFSILPTILLLSTMFRLSLNIASTKSILQTGSAGKLISAFGSFVVGDNIVVGILVFLIIILVQFMVVVKGSERISEVTARFTLDGMPMKLMSVDGELSNGLIDEKTARKKRAEINAQSDFYGAMDGSTKFTKGDTVAGLIISAINIIAGFIVGMTSLNLSFEESLTRFTMLTIGDGLLSSIPSLLIAVSTAIMVTRPFNSDSDNMGGEIFNQLGKNPMTFYICSAVLLLLALMPGVNKLVFIGLSVALATIGYFIKSSESTESSESITTHTSENLVEEVDYSTKFNTNAIEIEVGYGLVHLISKAQGGQLLDKLERIREKTLNNLGFLIPSIRTRDNLDLLPYQYKIYVNGLLAGEYEIKIGKLLAMSQTQEELEIEGISTYEPAFGYKAKFISKDLAKLAESKGYTVADTVDVIAKHFEVIVTSHSHEILNREMVKEMVEYVESKNATIVKELIPNLLTLGQVQAVLSNLLEEGVSIKNLNIILETLSDKAHLDKDPAVLTDFVRVRLRKQIINSLGQGSEIYCIRFTPATEEFLEKQILQSPLYTNFLAIKPHIASLFENQLEEFATPAIANGKIPIIVCSSRIRFYLSKYLRPTLSVIKVLSDEELSLPEVTLHNLGNINLVKQ